MNYKQCSRCKFRVPAIRKLCHVCGNTNLIKVAERHYESISFGSKHKNVLLKFKQLLAEITRQAQPIKQSQNLGAEQEAWQLQVAANRQHAVEADMGSPANCERSRSEEDIRKDIEELSQWFRNYGSGGLLTNRG